MGYSLGGVIAYEVARRLDELGFRPALLALMDTGFPDAAVEVKRSWRGQTRRIDRFSTRRLLRKPVDEWSPLVRGTFMEWLWRARRAGRFGFLSEARMHQINRVIGVSDLDSSDKLIARRYRCKETIDIPTVLFYTQHNMQDYGTHTLGWDQHILGPFEQRPVKGDHYSLQGMPAAKVISDTLREKVDAIRQAQADSGDGSDFVAAS